MATLKHFLLIIERDGLPLGILEYGIINQQVFNLVVLRGHQRTHLFKVLLQI